MAMNGNSNGLDQEFVEERVAYSIDPNRPDKFLPRISVMKTVHRIGRAKVDKSFRPFETDDIQRVLDFDSVPDPPPDGPLLNGESDTSFPSRHFCLRGGYLFYFDLTQVSGTGQSHYVTYHGPPLGVIPLEKVTIAFPEGGRRCFREHAQTDARKGYELAILHTPKDDQEGNRPPAFVVTDSLVQRDKWAAAIKARAAVENHTSMRQAAFGQDNTFSSKPTDILKQKESKKESSDKKEGKRSGTRKGKRTSMAVGKKDEGAKDSVVQEALQEFGKSNFSEKTWIDNYFETHNEVDAEARCKQMVKWQESIKKGLKNAVLEQYEYFVEASAEMTKMGREVVDLKTLVETQVETVKEMKEIDFTTAILGPNKNEGEGEPMFNDMIGGGRRRPGDDDASDVSSVSSFGDGMGAGANSGEPSSSMFRDPDSRDGIIDVPDFFEDAAEEILAFVKESRYSDATDLWAKAKAEVTDIMQQVSEQPSNN